MLLWQYKHICFFQNWRYCVRWLSDNTGVCYSGNINICFFQNWRYCVRWLSDNTGVCHCGNINTFVSFRVGDIVLGGSLTILVFVTVAI